MHHIRRYLIAGLLLWLPIWITLLVVRFVVNLLDVSLSLLPKAYQPDVLLGMHIPGVGVLVSLLIILLTGVLITNFLGRRLVQFGESIVAKIPLVRSIYMAVKQVLETLFSNSGQSFRKVYLIEYPRRGAWSIAFQTGECAEEIEDIVQPDMLTLFVPTTPNPTSGYLILVPRKEAYELKMSVEQALRLVISLGVVQPGKNLQTPENT